MNYTIPLMNPDIDSNLWHSSVKEDFFQHEVTTPQTCSFETQLLTPPNSSTLCNTNNNLIGSGQIMSESSSIESLSLMTPETDMGIKESPIQAYNSSNSINMPLPVQFVLPNQMQAMQPMQMSSISTPSANVINTPTSQTISSPLSNQQPQAQQQQQQQPIQAQLSVPQSNPYYQYPVMQTAIPPPPPSLLVSPVNEYLHPIYNQPQQPSPHQQYYNPSYIQYHPQFHQQQQQQQYQASLKTPQQTLQEQEKQQKELEMRKANAEELQQVKFVKLTPMTRERIEQIKCLAQDKGIQPSVVESVLLLYTPEGRAKYLKEHQKVQDDMSKLEGNDIYIKIVVNGGGLEECTSSSSQPTQQTQYQQQLNQYQPNQYSLTQQPISTPGAQPNDYYFNNINYAVNQACRSGRRTRKSKVGHVKRPLNSFMLYRKSQTQSAMAYAVHTQLKLNHQNISQIAGLMWQTESKEVKEQFTYFANREKEIHRVLHPNYKFCPQKKKKRVF